MGLAERGMRTDGGGREVTLSPQNPAPRGPCLHLPSHPQPSPRGQDQGRRGRPSLPLILHPQAEAAPGQLRGVRPPRGQTAVCWTPGAGLSAGEPCAGRDLPAFPARASPCSLLGPSWEAFLPLLPRERGPPGGGAATMHPLRASAPRRASLKALVHSPEAGLQARRETEPSAGHLCTGRASSAPPELHESDPVPCQPLRLWQFVPAAERGEKERPSSSLALHPGGSLPLCTALLCLVNSYASCRTHFHGPPLGTLSQQARG